MDRTKYLNKIKKSKSNELIEVPIELTSDEISDCYNFIISNQQDIPE